MKYCTCTPAYLKETETWLKIRQRIVTIGGSITVWLTSCLTGLDLNKQVKLFFIQISKAADSAQNKQDVSHTVILPIQFVFSAFTVLHTFQYNKWVSPSPLTSRT